MTKSYTLGIITLGCRVNQYESDSIMQELSKNGILIAPVSQKCDFYIINTCSVTQESDRKSRQIIRRCISKNPNATVIVTGCYSQINPEKVSSIPGVSYVFGNNNKSQIARLVLELIAKDKEATLPCQIVMSDIYNGKFDTMQVGAPLTRTRAFVKIQDGCESKCAYCIIPYARGSVRSNPPENVIREVENIASEGCVEVVLTGIETASYGKDFKNGYSLGDLLVEVNKIDGIKRIRLGSLDPSAITRELVDRIRSLDKVMPHFHISMQSGCTRILNLMRRKYNIEMARKSIGYLREAFPGCMLSADVITGFPGETNEDFMETLKFFEEEKFLHLHIFPYSKREGTPAFSMPNQVNEQIKKDRLHMLESLEKRVKAEILDNFIKNNHSTQALFETYDGEYAYGHTNFFMEIKVRATEDLCGKLLTVKPISTDGAVILGELI